MSVTFSERLIKEYQEEMRTSYGVFVDFADAQIHLRALARSMFPTVIAEHSAESRERSAMDADTAPCVRSLSAKMRCDGGNEVGASITPTSRHYNHPHHG
jgi:hypothetical protein